MAEILVQAFSNIAAMAVPAALVVAIDGAGMSAVAAAGIILWAQGAPGLPQIAYRRSLR